MRIGKLEFDRGWSCKNAAPPFDNDAFCADRDKGEQRVPVFSHPTISFADPVVRGAINLHIMDAVDHAVLVQMMMTGKTRNYLLETGLFVRFGEDPADRPAILGQSSIPYLIQCLVRKYDSLPIG